jgi:hypothetical protein
MKKPYVMPTIQEVVVGSEYKIDRKEARHVPRFPFAAAAEITESVSPSKLNGRITDLGLYGGYVVMPNPLPPGSLVPFSHFAPIHRAFLLFGWAARFSRWAGIMRRAAGHD